MRVTVTACMYLHLLSAPCFQHPTIPSILYCLHSASPKTPFLSHIEVQNMKLSFHSGALLFFLFFLLSSSKLCARPLATEQGQNRKLDKVSREDFVLELEGGESLKLLGLEDCNSRDEECLMRRMTLEAHLDYIYTDHHKP